MGTLKKKNQKRKSTKKRELISFTRASRADPLGRTSSVRTKKKRKKSHKHRVVKQWSGVRTSTGGLPKKADRGNEGGSKILRTL